MAFANLHGHSHYSLLDGFGSPGDIVKRAKELGYSAVALTDHGVTYGLTEFYKAARKAGIKPVLGCELYVARRTRFDRDSKLDTKPYHLIVLAKNNTGYQNLLKLVTQAHLEGFYYKPRVDYGLLKAHSKGLIALSGCLASHLSRSILAEDEEAIKEVVDNHLEIFGEGNYFFEMQDNPLLDEQQIVNKRLKKLSKERNIDLVVTFDSHYPHPKDSEVHDVLLCIQTASNVEQTERFRLSGDFSLRPEDELKSLFEECPEAVTNTAKVADMCNVELEFGQNLMPKFKTPNGEEPADHLRKCCLEGLAARFEGVEVPKEYFERLDFELSVVNKMGFDDYFLIVSDFVKFAKENKIVVGPGRGSAAGAIIAWSLNITDVDPIKYGLFFERFLNPERVSMPDIDIDFADHRRDEVLNYVVESYGRENVAQIVTFGTMAPRAAVRDVGRALGYPYDEVDILAKKVPPPVLGKHVPLIESTENDPELRSAYKNDPRSKVLLDYAKQLEGTVRHIGTHACAVVISEKPLVEYTAMQYGASKADEIVTQFSAKPLEDLGLLKMDFLGLRNLTVIENTCSLVKELRGEDVDMKKIPLDDPEVFELLKKGDTTGVFQLESGGMRRYLKELIPTEFEDIVAMGALYRPGPMEWIPTYIKGKHNPHKVKYLHDSFKEILSNTYGVAVYQEQILQLARDFAGFTLGEADILRKAVGKKDPKLLEEQREKFISGAVGKGFKKEFCKEVFEKIVEPFAGYGFNRAHAVCYGMIAYQTAYLKAHYPIEFMTALLCSDAQNMDRVALEIKECNEMGIEVLPPSINKSEGNFSVDNDGKIRFGLLSIKGVGEGPVDAIVKARKEGGEFNSIGDFCKRVPVNVFNKKTIQALAYCGAFEQLGDRNQLAENYDSISKFAKTHQEMASNGQASIFGIMSEDDQVHHQIEMRDYPVATLMQKLNWEKQLLGLYVSGHPIAGLQKYLSRKFSLIGKLTKKQLEKTVKVVGLITGLRKIITKNGAHMAIFDIEDPTACISSVAFPRTFSQYGTSLVDGGVVAIQGKLNFARGKYQIVADAIKPLSLNSMIENAKEAGLYEPADRSGMFIPQFDDLLEAEESEEDSTYTIDIPANAERNSMEQLKKLLVGNKGDTPVEINLGSKKKRISLPFGIDLTDELKKDINALVCKK